MPHRSAEAYERLRAQALDPEKHQNSDSDRVVLIRQGVAAWIKRAENQSLTSLPRQKPTIANSKVSPPQLIEEVVGLMAEIIIKSERFTAYA
jgi:hypothetical protein